MTDKPLGYECKHAIYCPAKDGSLDDLLVIKDYQHNADGTFTARLNMVENFKRNFYLTKPGFQKHKDKKEWEELSKLQKFTTNQARMSRDISKALNKPKVDGNSLRMLARSQYLYGADITTPVLMKDKYRKTWPKCVSKNQVAVMDIETDVVDGTDEIICLSLTFKNKAILIYTEAFVKGFTHKEVIDGTHAYFEQYLGETKAKRKIDLEVCIEPTPGDAVALYLRRAHEWKPDFIAIWNINFDLPICNAALEKAGYSLAEVYSDPAVPYKYRHAKYIEGVAQKVTASGKYMPLHPADRWHTMECPASFYFVDAMAIYKKIRITKGNEASYSLDAILEKNLGIRKLKFTEADDYTGLPWHIFMQKNYKLQYGIYNVFDCIAVELLDELNGDMASTLSVFCESSEYSKFPSQPRRTCDDLHFVCLDEGLVMGTTSDQMVDDNDEHILGMNDWIN